MINSRKIDDLHPHVAKLCRRFVAECKKQLGIEILITSTYRDHESQAAIYAMGRTKPGKIVTYAKPGQSWHNHRLAFDWIPVVHGKATWNDARTIKKCQEIGISLGLESLDFERVHFQARGGLTLAQVNRGVAPKFA